MGGLRAEPSLMESSSPGLGLAWRVDLRGFGNFSARQRSVRCEPARDPDLAEAALSNLGHDLPHRGCLFHVDHSAGPSIATRKTARDCFLVLDRAAGPRNVAPADRE